MDEWGLVPEDDMFHPPESDDPWWTETVWFSWMVPERNLLGYWYTVFRPNIGVNFGGVLVFDHTAVLPWEIPVFDWHWHQPMPEQVDLRDLDVLGGMTLRCEEHGRKFRFGYKNDDVEFDLTYDALMQPMLSRKTPPFNHGNHIDQPGRVAGSFVLHGESIEGCAHFRRARVIRGECSVIVATVVPRLAERVEKSRLRIRWCPVQVRCHRFQAGEIRIAG